MDKKPDNPDIELENDPETTDFEDDAELDFEDAEFEDADFEDDDFPDDGEVGDWDDNALLDDDTTIEAATDTTAPQQRTFLQKYFNLIALIIVGGIGGVLFLSFTGQPSQQTGQPTVQGENEYTAAPTGQPAEQITEIADNMPPSPTPIQSPAASAPSPANAVIELPPQDPVPVSGVPAESADTEANEDAQLPEAIETENASDPVNDDPLDLAGFLELDEMETVDESNVPAQPDAQQAGTPETEQESPLVPLPETTEPAENVTIEPLPELATEADNTRSETPEAEIVEVEPVETAPLPVATPSALPEAELQEIYNDIESLQNKLSDIDGRLSQRIDDTNKNLENITSQLAAINNTLQKQQTAPSPQKPARQAEPVTRIRDTSRAPTEMKVTPPRKTEVLRTSEPAPVAQIRTVPAQRSATELPASTAWVLRSAQPGRAIIAQKGSQDLKTVEVGDYLDGVGRINSVAIEDGQWVVRGSNSLIRQ